MKIVYPSTSFLFSNDNPSFSKIWGCLISLPNSEDIAYKSNQYPICDKCGAIKTSKGDVCPICNPDIPYAPSMEKKYIYPDCFLTSNSQENANLERGKFSTLICFAFDISSSSTLFQQIIYSMTSNDFLNEFKDCGFIFSFLINNSTVFVTNLNCSSDNLSFDYLPPLEESRFYSAKEFGNALIEAFSIIQVMALDLTVTEHSYSILFQELNQESSNSEVKKIDHLFLFYPTTILIPKKVAMNSNYYVHCIELNDKKTMDKKYYNHKSYDGDMSYDNFTIYKSNPRSDKSVDNLRIDTSNISNTANSAVDLPSSFDGDTNLWDSVLLSFQNGWTHSIISTSDYRSIQLIEYLKFCVKPILPTQVKISIQASPQLEIAWISANKILWPNMVNSKNDASKSKAKNKATVVVDHFQSDFSLIVTFQPFSKSSYESAETFGLQLVFEFANGQTFISNRSWKKASRLPKTVNPKDPESLYTHEWSDSVNVLYFSMICIKQRCSNYLMSYINNLFYSANSGRLFFRKKSNSALDQPASALASPSSSSSQNAQNQQMLLSSTSPVKPKILSSKMQFAFNWYSSGSPGSSNKFNCVDYWDVSSDFVVNKCNISSCSLNVARNVVSLFSALFVDDNSPINEKIRIDIICSTMSRGLPYFISLFNSLFSLITNPASKLYFPPFFLVSKLKIDESDLPDLGIQNGDKMVYLSLIRIELDEDVIMAIKNTIARYLINVD